MSPELTIALLAMLGLLVIAVVFRYPFAGLCIATLFGMLYSPKTNIGFANITLAYVLFILLIAGVVLRTLLRRRVALLPRARFHRYVFVVFAVLAISTVNSVFFDREVRFAYALKYCLQLGVMLSLVYITYLTVTTEEQIRKLAWVLLFGGFASAVFTFGARGFVPGETGSIVHENPNSFGNFLTLIAGFWLYPAVRLKLPAKKRLAAAIATAVTGLGVAYSLSRSSWLGMLLVIGFFIFLTTKLRYIAVFAAICVVFWNTGFVQDKLFGKRGQSGLEQRQVKIQMAIEYFHEKPILGLGPGGFSNRAARHRLQMINEHTTLENGFIVVLCNFGIAGCLAFLYFGWGVLLMYRRARHSAPAGDARVFAAAAFSALLAAFGIMFGEDLIFYPMNNWLCGLFIGILLVVPNIGSEPPRPVTAPARPPLGFYGGGA